MSSYRLNAEKSMQSQNHPEIVFDEQGIPIPELDGSIPDLFENNDNGKFWTILIFFFF